MSTLLPVSTAEDKMYLIENERIFFDNRINRAENYLMARLPQHEHREVLYWIKMKRIPLPEMV